MRGLTGCVAIVQVREMLLLSIAFSYLKKLKKKRGKKERAKYKMVPQRRPILWFGVFFQSDGYTFCKVSETSVNCRDMLGERGVLATVLRSRESELELLQGCLGNTIPDGKKRKGLVPILKFLLNSIS